MKWRLDAVRVTERRRSVDIDLRDVEWIDPVHLAYAASLAHRAHLDGMRPRLVGVSERLSRYASRMRLGQAFEQFNGQHDLPPVREWDRSDTLHEVRLIETPVQVGQLAELVLDRVYDSDPDAAEALYKGIAEIGGNVCEHSRAGLGFVAAQTIQTQGSLRFAVADAGVGIMGTLKAFGADSDRTAINMALSGTSSSGLPGHGTGLRSTVGAVSNLDGQVVLASGEAVTLAGQRGRRHGQLRRPLRGTVMEGVVPTVRAKHRAP